MKKIFLGISFAAALFTITANAAVLDFEGLTTSNIEGITSGNQGYGGFTWNSGWYLYSDNSYTTPAHSGDYGIVNNYGRDPLGFSITSGGTFDFNGAWIAGWNFNSPQQVKAVGYDADGNLVGESDWLSVIVNTNQYLSANLMGVTRIEFVGGQYFTVDDITYNASTVPLPAAAWLLGSGLIGLIGLSRRKRDMAS